MPTIPFPFQSEDLHAVCNGMQGRALVSWAMGLGKSYFSLLCAKQLDAFPAIVVCPASLKWVWEEQARDHFRMRSVVLGTTKPRRFKINHGCPLFIINYDVAWAWLDELKELNPKLIIVDECQRVGSRVTRQAKAVKALAADVPHVLLLSGTPMTSRPAELWQTLNIIAPEQYPSFHGFAHRFCNPKRRHWGWDFSGASNLDVLHDRLKTLSVRRRKEDVLHQLPAKVRTVVPLDVDHRDEYEQATEDFLTWLATTHSQKNVIAAVKAEAVVKIGHLKRLAARLKLRAAMEWIDDFLAAGNDKIILFAIHKAIVAKLMDRYKGCAVAVTGETPVGKRQAAFRKFLGENRTRILVGNIDAAGVGWSAKGVSNVAFVELPWVPAKVTQGEDRCVGIGRGQEGVNAQVFFLVARDTIESKLCKVLQEKQANFTAVFDGEGGGDELDVYDELLKTLQGDDHEKAGKHSRS